MPVPLLPAPGLLGWTPMGGLGWASGRSQGGGAAVTPTPSGRRAIGSLRVLGVRSVAGCWAEAAAPSGVDVPSLPGCRGIAEGPGRI